VGAKEEAERDADPTTIPDPGNAGVGNDTFLPPNQGGISLSGIVSNYYMEDVRRG
jgi:hypothetical protein